jgi:hypothetical protein
VNEIILKASKENDDAPNQVQTFMTQEILKNIRGRRTNNQRIAVKKEQFDLNLIPKSRNRTRYR